MLRITDKVLSDRLKVDLKVGDVCRHGNDRIEWVVAMIQPDDKRPIMVNISDVDPGQAFAASRLQSADHLVGVGCHDVIYLGRSPVGWHHVMMKLKHGGVLYRAGCQRFKTLHSALKHWGPNHHATADRDWERWKVVEAFAEARKRGWLKRPAPAKKVAAKGKAKRK